MLEKLQENNTMKLLILLAIPVFLVVVHFLPKEHGLFTHPFKRFLILAIPIFALFILPFLASRKYEFEMKRFVFYAFLMFVGFLVYILLVGSWFGDDLGDSLGKFHIEGYFILVFTFLFMVIMKYRYVHYFFFFLILFESINCIGRSLRGIVFPLNFGTVVYFPTLMFFMVYVLSEQYLKIKHNVALMFAFAYSFVLLGGMFLDISHLFVKQVDILRYITKYANYDMFFFGGVVLIIVGTALFFWATVTLFLKEKEKEKIMKKVLLLMVVLSLWGISQINLVDENIRQAISKDYKIISIEKKDFTGNGKDDFICTVEETDKRLVEHWLSDSYKRVNYSFGLSFSINHRWFVQLDEDKELEVIFAQGYEDGIDYFVSDFKNGRYRRLFYFNPIIKNGDSLTWGHPWEIEKVIVKQQKLLASFQSNIERDDTFLMRKRQKTLPNIFFEGNVTDYSLDDMKVEEPQFYSLDEILVNSLEDKKIVLEYHNPIGSLGKALLEVTKENFMIEDNIKINVNKVPSSMSPIFYKPDYGVVYFVAVAFEGDYYVIEGRNAEKFKIKDNSSVKILEWKEFMMKRVTGIGKSENTSKYMYIKPSKESVKSLIISFDELEIKDVEGNWMKIKNPKGEGWIEWRNENELLIEVSLLC